MPFPKMLLVVLALGGLACGPPQAADRATVFERDGSTSANGARGPSVSRGGGKNGIRCEVNAGCLTGACVDGVCCESTCAGSCQACNLPGSEGRCRPVPDGLDPANECGAEEASTCGRDGACDGKGACRRHPLGTECSPKTCQGSTERAPGTCDGMGTCRPGDTKNCAPAVCIGDSCGQGCSGDAECVADAFCDAGTCRGKRVQGAACDRASQCETGFCTDGVCCNEACTTKCHACNNAGSMGTCQAAGDGRDPRRECLVQAVFTCGNAGGCDGKGACKLHVAGAPCGYGSCEGSTVYAPSTCDGLGACKRGPGRDCDPYVCNGMSCWTACANNDQCKSGRTCNINACR